MNFRAKSRKVGTFPFASFLFSPNKVCFEIVCDSVLQKLKMPFIKVFTNQSKAQLGDKFMPTVCEKLGQVLNKDLKWFNWILETDKQMSKVTNI